MAYCTGNSYLTHIENVHMCKETFLLCFYNLISFRLFPGMLAHFNAKLQSNRTFSNARIHEDKENREPGNKAISLLYKNFNAYFALYQMITYTHNE